MPAQNTGIFVISLRWIFYKNETADLKPMNHPLFSITPSLYTGITFEIPI